VANPIKIAIAQIDIAFADRERNLARMVRVLEETAASGAKLTVFPEAALTGYCFDSLDEARPHAEPVPGPSTRRMSDVCRKLGCFAVYGLLELATAQQEPRPPDSSECIFNTCVLVAPTASLRRIAKSICRFWASIASRRPATGRLPSTRRRGCGSA
jgi:predicted amidohydrolase